MAGHVAFQDKCPHCDFYTERLVAVGVLILGIVWMEYFGSLIPKGDPFLRDPNILLLNRDLELPDDNPTFEGLGPRSPSLPRPNPFQSLR